MPDRWILNARGIEIDPDDQPPELARLAAGFPGRAMRRVSPLGLMMAVLLRDMAPPADAAIYYATSFTQVLALEAYLASLPHASPANFQTSIHPGGIEQALILARQPVRALYPLAGGSNLVSRALALALADERADVFLLGGEEAGTWLTALGIAAERSFACALHFGGAGRIAAGRASASAAAQAAPADRSPHLLEFTRAVIARRPLAWNSGHSAFSICWQ